MGLLDFLNNALPKKKADGLLGSSPSIATDPIAMAMMAYGTTGQGNNPLGTAMQTLLTSAQLKAKTEQEQRQKAQMAAMQNKIASGLSGGSVDPALLAQYAGLGGEGAKDMIDMYKFGRTPQTVTPGSMVYNPTTGAMTMPAPKMGEGQMWDGQGVSEAQGYGDVMQAQINRDLQKYGAQKSTDYSYDMGRIDAQTQADIAKYAANQSTGYGYDVGKMDYADQIARGQEAFKAGLEAQGDLKTVDNPDGSKSYTSRADILAGGGMAARSPEQAAYAQKRVEANAATYQGALDSAAQASQQLSNIDRMASLLTDIETGKGEQALMGLASIGEQLGVKIDPKLGDKQAVQSLANQLAIGMRQPGTGTMTDKDMEVFLQSVPSLQNSPDGNRKIMQTMAAFAEKKQKEAEIMQAYAERKGAWDDQGEKLLNQWRKNNPIKW